MPALILPCVMHATKARRTQQQAVHTISSCYFKTQDEETLRHTLHRHVCDPRRHWDRDNQLNGASVSDGMRMYKNLENSIPREA